MQIRPATDDDFPGIWHIFRHVAAAGDSFPHAVDVSRDEAFHYWMRPPRVAYLAITTEGEVAGMYYLRPNQEALGGHVANAGYCVGVEHRGRGLGRSLCEHSLGEARRLGYLAMQYNLVVSTNVRAVALWQKCGFEIVGTLPKAFRHPAHGLVDAYVMYQWLGD